MIIYTSLSAVGALAAKRSQQSRKSKQENAQRLRVKMQKRQSRLAALGEIDWLPRFCAPAIVRCKGNVVIYSKAHVTQAFIQHYRKEMSMKSDMDAECDAELTWADPRNRVRFVD